MALFRCGGESGGGGGIDTLVAKLNDATVTTSDSSGRVSVTNGKTYLVMYGRGGSSTPGLVSGGTALYEHIYSDVISGKTYFGIIRATSTALTFNGSGNPTYLAQLD